MSTPDLQTFYQNVHQLLVKNGASAATLADVDALFAGDTSSISPPAETPPAAYEIAPLTADQAVMDGNPNKDGSTWTMETGEFDPGQGVETRPVRHTYGYYSPVKNPNFFAYARSHWGGQFAQWEANLATAPYTLFSGDPDAYIATGDPNYITFVQFCGVPQGTFVQ